MGAVTCGALSRVLVASSSSAAEQDVARALRRPLAEGGDRAHVNSELVRYATLAPSSHNTQCWTSRTQDQPSPPLRAKHTDWRYVGSLYQRGAWHRVSKLS